jgi:hypothetical protein
LRAGLKRVEGLKQYSNQEIMEQGALIDCMERLTESRFDYDIGAWGAAAGKNVAALDKFAAWIENRTKK